MKTILIIEDNLYTADYLSEIIRESLTKGKNIRILNCNNIFEADFELDNHDDIKMIIADLNMSPLGLEDDLIEQTLGATLTGWIWVKDRIIKNRKEIKVCFYTGFTELLEEDEDFQKTQKLLPKGMVTIVSKGESSIISLIKEIKRITGEG